MENKKKCTKKILSILIILTIIINLLPNFGLLAKKVYATETKGIVVKPGISEFKEIDGNKIYKLDVYLKNVSTGIWYLKLEYDSNKMIPAQVEDEDTEDVLVRKATKAEQAVVFTDENNLFELETSMNRELVNGNNGKGYIFFGGINVLDEVLAEGELLVCTINFMIKDSNLNIEDIASTDFNVINAETRINLTEMDGDVFADEHPEYFHLEEFIGTPEPTVQSIAVKTNPTEGQKYIHEDTINLTNGELTLTYTDGSTKDISMLDEEVIIKTGESIGAVADIDNPTLTFEYEECSTSLDINVIDPVEKIEFYDKNNVINDTYFSEGTNIPTDELFVNVTTKSGRINELRLDDSHISLDSNVADVNKILNPVENGGIYSGIQPIKITYTDEDRYTATTNFHIIVNDRIASINITKEPKTEYIVNDKLEKNGKIEIIGESGKSYGEIDMTSDSVIVTEADGMPVDLSTPAENKELIVSFGGVTKTYSINVKNTIESIRVNGSVQARYNEPLTSADFSGITVIEIMADGAENPPVDLNFDWVDTSSFDSTIETTQYLTVNYPYNGETIQGQVAVTVKDELLGITIDNFVTEYEYNDELDYTGAQFSAQYVSGVFGPIDFGEGDLEISGFDSTEIGEQELTFTYDDGENTASTKVTVNVDKATPEYTIPTNLEGYEGNELSSVDTTLYPGFSWTDSTEELTLGTDNKYKTTMIYTPDDQEHYKVVEGIEVEISVIPVEVTSIEITKEANKNYVEGQNFDPTGMEITVTYNTGKTIVISSNYEEKGVTFSPALTDALTTANTEVTVSYSEKTDTQGITVETKKVTSIEVTKAPTKTTYVEGQRLELAGIEITANYNDGDRKVIENYTANPANGEILSTVGSQDITITYDGTDAIEGIESVKTSVVVEARKVTSIEVTNAPTKTEYVEGQKFEKAGMVVTAYYNDDTDEIVTDYTIIDETRNLTTLDTKMVISYEGQTVEQEITVVEKIVTSIEVTNAPTKTEYVEGESFDTTGMIVTATYNDGDTAVTTDYTISPAGALTPANETVTITYIGTDIAEDADAPTATVDITVSEREIESIAITTPPTNTSYIEGQSFDPTGMEITVTYNDHTNPLVINSDYGTAGVTFEPSTNLQQINTKVTVSYRGKTAEQEITVIEDTVTDITIVAPNKKEYNYGDAIDLTGATITKIWASGLTHENDTIPMTKEMLSNADITSFDGMDSLGEKEITVTYDTVVKTNAFQVKIEDYVDRIEIEDKTKLKTEYEYGDTINVTDKNTGAKLNVLVKYAGGTPDERVELTTSMVSGYSMTTLGNQTVTVTHLGKTDSYTINVKDKVTGIEITKEPAKKVYKLGESASFGDTVVKNVMASSAEGVTLIVGEYTFSGFDSTTTGEKTITVTKVGTTYTDTFIIKVIDATTAMNITNMPKTTYNYGEGLSIAGGEITVATQTGTEILPMTDSSVKVTGYNPNKLGNQTLTVTYTYTEETDTGIETKTLTDTYTVTVNDYETGAIQITPPTKTTYDYGEGLDLTGGKVGEKMASGTTKNEVALTGGMVSGYNATMTGTQTLTVTYNGKTATFNITVVDKTLGISMNKLPNKTQYTKGEALNIAGAVLNITKQSGIKEIPITKEMISGYNPSKIGTQVITVTYDGHTTTFIVNVKAKPTTPTKPTKPTRPTNPSKPSTSDTVKYTVKFVDYNGTVLKEEEVESGKSATAPEVETRVGYKFLGWDRAFDIIEKDMIITAKYERIIRAEVNAPDNMQVEEGEEIDLSEVTLIIRDEEGNEIDEIPVTEDMISGFDPEEIGRQTITVTYVDEDGYEYTATFKVRVKEASKPVETLGEKDEIKEESNIKDTLLPASIGLGITGLLLLLIALVTRKNVEIYAITDDKRELVGKEKISKENARIVLDKYEKQLENANMVEIVLNKNITKKLDGETTYVVRKGMKSTYKVSSNAEEEFNIRIKNN